MTSTKFSFISVEKSDRLHSGYIETLAATHVLAGQHVFAAHHVRTRLGEFCAIPFVGPTRQLPLLGADHPPDVVFVLLPAVRAGQRGFPGFLSLVVKFALFHRKTSW